MELLQDLRARLVALEEVVAALRQAQGAAK